VIPAPENDDIYNKIAWTDPEIHELVRSIKEHGIQEPLLISTDGFIISGHRRRQAALLAELDHVPVRVHPVSRAENPAEFLKLLVEMNTQPSRARANLFTSRSSRLTQRPRISRSLTSASKRRTNANVDRRLSVIDPLEDGRRCKISKAKAPLLEAINRVLEEQREYWASVR
jgi:hypothetical protein